MVFICMFALAPGNGDAFNSFLLSDPDELAGGDWPGGIAPLNFSDSDFAYVGTVAAAASAFGTWIFRRYLRTVVRTHALVPVITSSNHVIKPRGCVIFKCVIVFEAALDSSSSDICATDDCVVL